MKDALDRKLNIDDHVALMVENYNNRFEGFVSGIVIGFTENYVKIRLDDQFIDTKYYQLSQTKFNNHTNSYENTIRKIILRRPHRIIKI